MKKFLRNCILLCNFSPFCVNSVQRYKSKGEHMTYNTQTVNLRELTADEGMVITDKETMTLRAKTVYLGKGEKRTNFIEIDENTPLPEEENYG